MKKIAIKGHSTRGEEVIELLEMMGGINSNEAYGNLPNNWDVSYYIFKDGVISVSENKILIKKQFEIFTLEEFLEKYPFKVGDFGFAGNWSYAVDIRQMHWNAKTQEVEYMVKPGTNEIWYTTDKLTRYIMPKFNVGETVYNKHTRKFGEIVKYQWQKDEYIYLLRDLMNEVWYTEKQLTNDVKPVDKPVDNENKMKNVLSELLEHIKTTPKDELEREFEEIKEWSNVGPTIEEFRTFCECVNKKPKYPTTYEECCDVICYDPSEDEINCYKGGLLESFVRLLICRDTYWDIAGEQMGLGKPWEPDWNHINRKFYCIYNSKNNIVKNVLYTENKILAFPIRKMRDAFYENFKELIEQCKELL